MSNKTVQPLKEGETGHFVAVSSTPEDRVERKERVEMSLEEEMAEYREEWAEEQKNRRIAQLMEQFVQACSEMEVQRCLVRGMDDLKFRGAVDVAAKLVGKIVLVNGGSSLDLEAEMKLAKREGIRLGKLRTQEIRAAWKAKIEATQTAHWTPALRELVAKECLKEVIAEQEKRTTQTAQEAQVVQPADWNAPTQAAAMAAHSEFQRRAEELRVQEQIAMQAQVAAEGRMELLALMERRKEELEAKEAGDQLVKAIGQRLRRERDERLAREAPVVGKE